MLGKKVWREIFSLGGLCTAGRRSAPLAPRSRMAPLRIGQNLISFVNLEETFAVGSRADVGMDAEDEPAIRTLDCREVGARINAQDA